MTWMTENLHQHSYTATLLFWCLCAVQPCGWSPLYHPLKKQCVLYIFLLYVQYCFWVFVLFHTILQVVSLNYNKSWSVSVNWIEFLSQVKTFKVIRILFVSECGRSLVIWFVWSVCCGQSLFKNCKTMFDWCVTGYTSAAIKKYLSLGYDTFALMHWKHLTLVDGLKPIYCFKRQNAYQKHHEVCQTALMI